MIRLYGTITSPYVRRVRVVAEELGLAHELIDTATDAGQARLREKTPTWKVPAADIDGLLVFDSHAITELLLERVGSDAIAPWRVDDVEARNVLNVVDGALDALINVFYLRKEGVDVDQVPYLKKQQGRARAALGWLENHAYEPYLTSKRQFGLPEIGLGTALGWMRFRNAYPIDDHPRLLRCLEQLEQRASFRATQPA
ncbi:MAG TPA: glutathione S-transferase family protein [Polyangiales bacterium]